MGFCLCVICVIVSTATLGAASLPPLLLLLLLLWLLHGRAPATRAPARVSTFARGKASLLKAPREHAVTESSRVGCPLSTPSPGKCDVLAYASTRHSVSLGTSDTPGACRADHSACVPLLGLPLDATMMAAQPIQAIVNCAAPNGTRFGSELQGWMCTG